MSYQIKTKVTEMLGIEYPIVQGCMQWIARAGLVGAVSEAGGLGVLSSSTHRTAEDLRAEIRKVKEITSKPFAVNITLLPSLYVPDYDGFIRVCGEEGVKIIETAGRIPSEDMIAKFKENGMVWIHKCTIAKHALKAQKAGCDMIVADGFECAGHPGENDIGTMVLTPRCVEVLDVPVITAGGVGTGRQMAAALMLGAQGVYMGTRFLLSEECPVLDPLKQHLAANTNELDTILLLRSYVNTTRAYKSEMAKSVAAREKQGLPFSAVAEDMSGVKAQELFFENGDYDHCGTICLGQVTGVVHDVLPVRQIIEDMMKECVETIRGFQL
ncbi:MAG: nitronate monooxygenase [Oscillospiraceae bacterium]|nr:nitronate monooxygenase [Oscillospiraceae bacterium]